MRARLWLIVGVLLAATPAGAAPPHTPTRTATWTAAPHASATPVPTGTATATAAATPTGTRLPGQRIKLELIDWPTPAATPPSAPACALVLRSDNLLPECLPGAIGGGGSITTPFGASYALGYREEHVATVTAAPTIATVFRIPGNVMVVRCYGRTNSEVHLTTGGAPFTGGYFVGMASAPKRHGHVAGTVGASNAGDTTFPHPHPNYVDSPVYVTPEQGTFADTGGEITVSCVFAAMTGPTQ